MIRIRAILTRARSDDGMSLVEVVVALMIFAVISLGVGYSTLTIIKMTDDTRSRQVATNLATSEIDFARSFKDPFDIVYDERTATVGAKVFTIIRETSWVTTSGADVGCGTGTGTLQAKRVNVTVTWAGMLSTTDPVRSDTLISPDNRINDPKLGTIRISVLNAAGTGSAGVAVTITPTSTGTAALTTQPDVTDTDGCSYALKVPPGTYNVAVARSNSIDDSQNTAPVKSVTVTAGTSVAALFQYDTVATFNLTYGTGAPKLPDNLQTTYVSTYGLYLDTGRKSSVKLHPFTSGYTGIAGKYITPIDASPGVAAKPGCVSVDPGAWKAGTVNNVALGDGVRPGAVAATPGGSVGMTVPMGVVTVQISGTTTLTAESATAAASTGDPGCAVGMSYSFGSVTGNQTIALPYGSWTIYTTSNGVKSAVPATKLGLVGSLLGALLGTNTVITLDPRPAK